MLKRAIGRRKLLAATAIALLAACTTQRGPVRPTGPVEPVGPDANVLPSDSQRHRVALLVPLSGSNAAAGQSLANATTMALLDTNAQNLRITTYDTAAGAGPAATKAIADGNRLILGPLLSEDIPPVAAAARAAHVPVISYSNDEARASRDVFIMGSLPGQSIDRTIAHARGHGMARFAALIPMGEYGQRAQGAFTASVRAAGGSVVGIESFSRTTASLGAAVRRLRARGEYDAVLVADGGRISALAGPMIKVAGAASPRILGTELWSGETAITATPALRGAWFSAVADERWRQFSASYRTRFGGTPYRIATLGYDSVLLTLRVAREWRPGTLFPTGRLYDREGFLGIDGAFRFRSNGAIERALEVREVRAGGITVASPAPGKFTD